MKMENYKKSFKYWKTQEVEDFFGIQPSKDKSFLEDWLSSKCILTEDEKSDLEELKEHLISKVKYWNEAALKFYFIGPLMRLVKYDTDKFNSFLEQTLSIKLDDGTTISGNVDFLVATGKQIPKVPFFTLHEYKPEPNQSTDPQGQLLVSMVAAQKYNEAKGIHDPLYGVYVIGRLWFFIILKGNEYAASLAYDATQEDLTSILCILKNVKQRIEKQLENMK